MQFPMLSTNVTLICNYSAKRGSSSYCFFKNFLEGTRINFQKPSKLFILSKPSITPKNSWHGRGIVLKVFVGIRTYKMAKIGARDGAQLAMDGRSLRLRLPMTLGGAVHTN